MIWAITLLACTTTTAHAQRGVEVFAAIARGQHQTPALPLPIRSAFERPGAGFGATLGLTAWARSKTRIRCGATLQGDYTAVNASASWPSVRTADISAGPRATIQLTSIISLVSSLRLSYSALVRGNGGGPAESMAPTPAYRVDMAQRWDARGELGIRGTLGQVHVSMTAERGLDHGGDVVIVEPTGQAFAPRYYYSALRFAVGLTLPQRAVE